MGLQNIVCEHCGAEAYWSRFLDLWWCFDCRMDDVVEVEGNDLD